MKIETIEKKVSSDQINLIRYFISELHFEYGIICNGWDKVDLQKGFERACIFSTYIFEFKKKDYFEESQSH